MKNTVLMIRSRENLRNVKVTINGVALECVIDKLVLTMDAGVVPSAWIHIPYIENLDVNTDATINIIKENDNEETEKTGSKVQNETGGDAESKQGDEMVLEGVPCKSKSEGKEIQKGIC